MILIAIAYRTLYLAIDIKILDIWVTLYWKKLILTREQVSFVQEDTKFLDKINNLAAIYIKYN